MRFYQKQIKEPVIQKVLVKITCDLCGAETKNSNWGTSFNEINNVEISVTINQQEGAAYPEGVFGTEFNVDLCPTCFKTTLIPFLREKGAKIEERELNF